MKNKIKTRNKSSHSLKTVPQVKVAHTTNSTIEDIKQIQYTEHMEVHHHAHSHGKKNWRTYGWEFGMLFLAVFCGFLAEYLLEHRIEKERGKQYVLSMIEDLESDAAKIPPRIDNLKQQELGLDSLSLLCSNPPYNDSTIKRMYQLMNQHTTIVYSPRFTKRTIVQLRNSGGMRLITNKASADAITEYNELVEGAESQEEYYKKYVVGEILPLNGKIFNVKYTRTCNKNNIDHFFMKSYIVTLVNNDEKLMAEYSSVTYLTSKIASGYIKKLQTVQEQIPKTIAILKEKNHLTE